MEEEVKLLDTAFELYNLDNREDLDEQILEYIADRLIINKSPIIQMIDLLNENITFEDIWNVFNKERNKENIYKISNDFKIINDKFFMGSYYVPVGNIVIETDDILQMVKYFVRAIKSRNTVTISNVNYNEVSVESMILVIFCEALAKFGLDRNMIMILPFEECYYENYDNVIIIESDKKQISKKEIKSKAIIYKVDSEFDDIIKEEEKLLKEKGFEYQIIEGDFYDVVKKINKINPTGACIYTSNPQLGYKFINLIHSNNVFVNTSLTNMNLDNLQSKSGYIKKKIIYPIPSDVLSNYISSSSNMEKEADLKEDKKIASSENNKTVSINENADNISLVPKTNSWYRKIIDAIKKFLFK